MTFILSKKKKKKEFLQPLAESTVSVGTPPFAEPRPPAAGKPGSEAGPLPFPRWMVVTLGLKQEDLN